MLLVVECGLATSSSFEALGENEIMSYERGRDRLWTSGFGLQEGRIRWMKY